MTKHDFILSACAIVVAVALGAVAVSIPTAPGPYQRAVNDRIIKIKLLEIRSLPGSFSVDLPIKAGELHAVTWKDENGEPFKATFIFTDNGELSPGYGFSGDFVPVANWYEVE